jgi:serine phosphatase RsbU (regulator of sigma subunit)
MKRIIVIVICSLLCVPSFSQKGKEYFLIDSISYETMAPNDKAVLDSLLPLYHKAKSDTAKLHFIDALSSNLGDSKAWHQYSQLANERTRILLRDSAFLTSKEILVIKNYFGNSLQNIGFYYNLQGDKRKAMDYYKKSLKILRETGNKSSIAGTLNNMSVVFNQEGNIQKALDYQFQSLKIDEELHDSVMIANAYNNIGRLFIDQDDTVKALIYLKKGVAILEELKYDLGLAYSFTNIAVTYRNEKNYGLALEYFKKSFLHWSKLGDKHGYATTLLNLGITYLRRADDIPAMKDSSYILAMEKFKMAMKVFEEINDREGLSNTLQGMSRVYFYENKIALAEESGKRALRIAQEIKFPATIKVASEILYKIYSKQNKWRDALAMHELFVQMRDSISNEETHKSTFKQQMKYEYEKQEALKNVEHQKELAVAEEGKKRQKFVSYSIGAGLLMLIFFSLFIFNRLQITRKQKLIIEDQKTIVDEKNKHITDSINYAKRIQDAILPSKESLKKEFPEHFIFFQPREIVSGDFYWMAAVVLPSGGRGAVLALADCTGHGVPGAFMSMIGNTLLNEIVNEQKIIQPAEILNHLNEGIVHALHQESRSQDDGMDITMCLFDHDAGILHFAGANHSLYVADDQAITKIEGDYYSIGNMFEKKSVSFTRKEIRLQKNTTVFLSTDGYADQPGGEKGKKFMSKRFEELLLKLSLHSIQEQELTIKKTFQEWKTTKQQIDDVLVVGIKIQ